MPRRKKSGQSPARAPGGSPERGSLGHSSAHRDPAGSDGAMETNFPPSASLSSSAKQKIVSSMQEMFSHLDPEVLYIVLSEADFKGTTTPTTTPVRPVVRAGWRVARGGAGVAC